MRGISASASGWLVVFVHVDSRSWRLHQRLSFPAVRALLAARPHAPPLLGNEQAFALGGVGAGMGAGMGAGLGGVGGGVGGGPGVGGSSLPKALAAFEHRTLNAPSPTLFPQAVLQFVAHDAEVDAASFRQLPSRGSAHDAPPTPLYHGTGTQIGLLPAPW